LGNNSSQSSETDEYAFLFNQFPLHVNTHGRYFNYQLLQNYQYFF